MQRASSPVRRRRFLHDYFGLPPPESESCGACDVCADREAWLASRFPARAQAEAAADAGRARDVVGEPAPEPTAAAESAVPQRGDFVRVDGRLLGRVLRVSGKGRDARVEVELSSSLETRTFSVRHHRIERLEE